MLNMVIIGLIGVLTVGMAVYTGLQSFRQEKTNSYLYTDLAVNALDDLYKTGKLSQEDFLIMKKAYTGGDLG